MFTIQADPTAMKIGKHWTLCDAMAACALLHPAGDDARIVALHTGLVYDRRGAVV